MIKYAPNVHIVNSEILGGNTVEDHSKKKLTLYRLYLTAYLSVLTNQPHIKNINIVDLFAGVGTTEDGHHGSAVIAAKTAEGFSKKTGKNIHLVLNEYDKQRYDCLVKNTSFFLPCRDIMNQTANACFSELWQSYQNVSDTRTLFFIDPYGYTQFSHDNLSKLLQHSSSEVLIFVPISHILRFIDRSNQDESVKPVKQFLDDCGIDFPKYHVHPNDFAELIKDGFKKIAGRNSFAYYYLLKNEQARNVQHCMFFITHNSRGADKFIEAMYKIRKDDKESLLFDYDLEGTLKKLVAYLHEHEYQSNVDINNWRRENGYHNPEITNALSKLEDEKKMEVEEIHKRHGKSFYLGNAEKKLYVRMTKS